MCVRTSAIHAPIWSISGSSHAAGGDRRSAEADAACFHRGQGIERDGVFVDGDAGAIEGFFGVGAGDVAGVNFDQEQVIVGAAGDDAEALFADGCRERFGVDGDLLLVFAEAGSMASFRQTALAAMVWTSGPPWVPGKVSLSSSLANAALHSTMPPRGPRSVLCVVVETMSACGTGLGCTPAATRPAMWAMSTKKSASTALATLAMRSNSMMRE